jgi:polyisoprenyl-phosphate glycosyltransferase
VRTISVIIPVYNEEGNLRLFHERLTGVLKSLEKVNAEIIYVDDHCTDGSAQIIRQLSEVDRRVKTLRLSRNFGSHIAIRAGLDHCAGDAACVFSADLQDPPEILPQLIAEMDLGYNIVWACPETRRDAAATILFSKIYYRLMAACAFPEIWEQGADIFLADRKAVDCVKGIRERNTNIFMLLLWSGFSQGRIGYHSEVRHAGRSKWGLGKKIKLVADSLVSFSLMPIRAVFVIGIVLLLLGFIAGAFAVAGGTGISTFKALLPVLLILSGIQITLLGVVAEYLWRAFDEARGRPLYILEERRAFPES